MGATYTRQSTYSDGDVITAAHTNDEFNQLLAAFQASSGHTHDGTANEGGPITKMLGTSLTLGDGTAGTDITVTFDGETNDGVLKWMEDEDYFEFSDDILIASTEKIQFGDTATFLQQSSDGVLRIDGEATIDLNASTAVTVSNDLKLDSDSAVLGFGADNDVTLTHVADTALLLNDAIKLTFRDSALSVSSSTDGQLDIDADTEVEITAPLLEISADATVGDDLTLKSDAAVLGFGADTDTTLTHVADTGLLLNSSRQLQFGDSGTYIHQSADGVLDLVADTEIEINATTIDINGAADISGNLTVGGNLTVSGTMDFGDSDISNVGSIALDTITDDGGSITLDSSGDIILDADGANVTFKDGGTSILDIANNSSDVELTVSVADKNFAIKGTDDSSAITALDIDMALNGKATFSGDVVVTGDLTVTGDDITMGTNTSGHIMVADGTNFNPVAVSGDVTIAANGAVTIANGAVETAMVNANVITGQTAETSLDTSNDTILIHDADAGSLKKTTLASISSALGGITDVVADTSPQLGGNLDTNSHNILIDDAHFIADENGNEQIIFQTTASAVNQIDVTNAATGNAPEISATGGDTNISLKLTPKGSGQVLLDGNVGIESGLIDLKNAGSRSQLKFYCETGNQHAQTLQAQAHGQAASNTLTLPGGTAIGDDDATLVSDTGTQTLTNKRLTSPKINEDVALTATATELNLLDGVSGLVQADFTKLAAVDSTAAELNLVDGSSAGTIVNSKAVIYGSSGEVNATTLQIAGTSITASAADINLIDGITNGTVIASKAIITDANKDISGGRNITISGELDAATLDISGDADIDGTLEADAITVNGSTLNSVIADEAVALSIALG